MDKHQNEERRRQEDIALNRALVWVGAAIVLELLLLLVNKYFINVYTTQASVNLAIGILTGLKALRIVALVGVIACAVWLWMNLKKNSRTAATSLIALLGCAALGFCAHIIVVYRDSGIRMLFLLVPAWAALALIYYLYQKEFFYSACFSGLGVVALWLIRHRVGQDMTVYVSLAVMAVALVAAALLLNKTRQNEGVLTISGRTFHVLPADANYTMLSITWIASVAAVVLGLLLGGTVAYYLIYALVAWLFCLLVYYTVKMM